MSSLQEIKGLKAHAGVATNIIVTEGGILFSAPVKLLWSAKGYGAVTRSTTAGACVVDEPSTAAQGTLWNGEADGGKVYVIDKVFAYQDVSGADARFALWACVHDIGMAAVTADVTIFSMIGATSYGGNARFDEGATVVDDGWFPISRSADVETTGVLGGAVVIADVFGSIIIPPSSALSLHCVSSSADEDVCTGVMWYEVPQSELALE